MSDQVKNLYKKNPTVSPPAPPAPPRPPLARLRRRPCSAGGQDPLLARLRHGPVRRLAAPPQSPRRAPLSAASIRDSGAMEEALAGAGPWRRRYGWCRARRAPGTASSGHGRRAWRGRGGHGRRARRGRGGHQRAPPWLGSRPWRGGGDSLGGGAGGPAMARRRGLAGRRGGPTGHGAQRGCPVEFFFIFINSFYFL
jgi:hypothetical protein